MHILRVLSTKIKILGALSLASGVLLMQLLVPLPAFAAGPNSTQGIPNAHIGDCYASYSSLNSTNCGIVHYIVVITNIVSGLAGLIIVISIVWAGVQYSMAKSDPQAVAAARHRIGNSILALFIFIFFFAFLQWLVPGGIF